MAYHPKNSAETAEDCRDFLRTGRCKYGASCKFNHPPNVQSGGGIKTPIDPSEPLFPVRLNEPVCQYYMKHGTCKFSQACKFHHPPLSSLQTAASVSSNAVFLPRVNDQHIVMNSVGQDQGSTAVMLQFLPQRPDEPDCLYFLRNGTCKYGATCRYHHPVSSHPSRKAMDTQRRSQQQVIHQGQVLVDGAVQYVQSQSVYQQTNSRVVSTSGGQHMLVTETPIHLKTIRGGSLQPIPGDDFGVSACGPVSMSQRHTSSSSSIASSYETISSGGQGGWDRSKRSHSGGSLSAFADTRQIHQHNIHASSRMMGGNDSSAQSRQNGAASIGSSMGSTGDLNGYQDGVIGWPGGNVSQNSLQVHHEHYDEGRFASEKPRLQSPFSVHNEIPQRHSHQGQTGTSVHRVPSRQSRVGNVDHGLSLMTSALLNMMDQPEDMIAKSYPSRISSSSTLNNSASSPTTPPSGNMHSPLMTSTSMFIEHRVPISASSPNLYHDVHRLPLIQTPDHPVHLETSKSSSYEQVSAGHYPSPVTHNDGLDRFEDSDPASDYRDWSLSWQYPLNEQDGRKANAESSLEHRSPNRPPSPLSNGGFYFP